MSRRGTRWPAALDGATDGLLVAFAAWTLFYQGAIVGQFSMLWAGWPWIVLAVGAAVAGAWWELRRDSTEGDRAGRGSTSMAVKVGTVALLAIVTVLVVGRETWGVWPAAVAVIAVVLVQLLPWIRSRGAATGVVAPREDAGPLAHGLALVLSLGLGVLNLFLLRPDADDVFYVNRATWVATHGTAALDDTMFSANTMPPAYAGGIPMPSIEALQGVLAHALGIQAATFCYLVAAPVLAALAGWTTWRLVREWAPRRAGLAMLVAVVFLLASGDSIVGSYSLGRIWQGKATAFVVLLPLVWLLLSRAARRSSRTDLVLLLAAGIAFVGLTTTSSLLGPLIGGAAVVAAIVLRSASLAKGAACFLAGPIVASVVQVVAPAAIGGGGDNTMIPPEGAFAIAFGPHLAMMLIAVAAVALAPRLVPGPGGVLIGCGVVASMVALLPGVFELADALTGAGAVAWRLVIGLPLWVLVGLLVAWLPAGAPRPVTAVGVAVALAVPVLGGTWLWSAEGASLTSRPTWKVDQDALSDVRAVQRLDAPEGLWQLPQPQMEVLAISTVDVQAVTPRGYYLPTLQVPQSERDARQRLLELEVGLPVTASQVRAALDLLDVSVACVPGDEPRARRILRRAVGQELREVGRMRCHVGRAQG